MSLKRDRFLALFLGSMDWIWYINNPIGIRYKIKIIFILDITKAFEVIRRTKLIAKQIDKNFLIFLLNLIVVDLTPIFMSSSISWRP